MAFLLSAMLDMYRNVVNHQFARWRHGHPPPAIPNGRGHRGLFSPGQTALHFAVDYGDEAVEVVEKLIAGGAKVDVANKFGLGLRSLRLGISRTGCYGRQEGLAWRILSKLYRIFPSYPYYKFIKSPCFVGSGRSGRSGRSGLGLSWPRWDAPGASRTGRLRPGGPGAPQGGSFCGAAG